MIATAAQKTRRNLYWLNEKKKGTIMDRRNQLEEIWPPNLIPHSQQDRQMANSKRRTSTYLDLRHFQSLFQTGPRPWMDQAVVITVSATLSHDEYRSNHCFKSNWTVWSDCSLFDPSSPYFYRWTRDVQFLACVKLSTFFNSLSSGIISMNNFSFLVADADFFCDYFLIGNPVLQHLVIYSRNLLWNTA